MFRFSLAIVCLISCFQGFVGAQDKAATAEIGELNEAYVTAFNARSAEKVAACFGKSGDYTLLTGDTINGRKMIQAAHQSFFKNNPNAKVNGKQVSYRQVRPGIVLATGVWEVTDGPSTYPSSGIWFTVVVKQKGKWHYQAIRLMVPAGAK